MQRLRKGKARGSVQKDVLASFGHLLARILPPGRGDEAFHDA